MNRKTIRRLAALSLSTATLTACGNNERQLSCPAPDGATLVAFQDVPSVVLNAVFGRVGEVVPPGAGFDPTDVVETGHDRRFAFFWMMGQRWIIATELGGIGYSNPVFAFDVDELERNARFVAQESAFPETLCETAATLLAAPSSHSSN